MHIIDSTGQNTYDLSKATSFGITTVNPKDEMGAAFYALDVRFSETDKNAVRRILHHADKKTAQAIFCQINLALAGDAILFDVASTLSPGNERDALEKVETCEEHER